MDRPDFAVCLRECLRTFEGAFPFDRLFTDGIAGQVYGYCWAGHEPVVVWDPEAMASDPWRSGLRAVRSALGRAFPA
ncbi:hypothetical protein [Streptomyces albus]|uniref:hypothetical protein n=1 Tax=Streptomyces albus TaxID=1888 RepID=UPI0033EB2792